MGPFKKNKVGDPGGRPCGRDENSDYLKDTKEYNRKAKAKSRGQVG